MTAQSAVFGIPRLAPLGGGPGQADEPLAARCTRCGAVGTHYLTCPSLRLPPGYRLSEDLIGPVGPVGPVGPGFPPGLARPRGGPDHPDWPRPPRP